MSYEPYTDATSLERLLVDRQDFQAQVAYQTQHGHDIEAHIARQGLALAEAELAHREKENAA